MGTLLDGLAFLIAIAAGGYLLTKGSPPIDVGGEQGQSWFEIIAHGMGAYFVARGIAMGRSLYLTSVTNDRLAELVDAALAEHARKAPPDPKV